MVHTNEILGFFFARVRYGGMPDISGVNMKSLQCPSHTVYGSVRSAPLSQLRTGGMNNDHNDGNMKSLAVLVNNLVEKF